MCGRRQPANDLGDAPPRREGGGGRQGVGREEANFGNLAIGMRWWAGIEGLDDIDRDMVAGSEMCVEQQSVQPRRRDKADRRFLDEFAPQGLLGGLAGLDTAARQLPAGHIGVAHQQDMSPFIDYRRSYAERQAAREARPEMQEARQLEPFPVRGPAWFGEPIGPLRAFLR